MAISSRIKKQKKPGITIYEGILIALFDKDDRKATFKEIASIIEERGLFADRKSSVSLAREIELKITASTSKYKHWFTFTKPDILTLKDMSYFAKPESSKH